MTLVGVGSALGPGGEFDRIRAMWRRLKGGGTGLGDDCAIVELGGARLALSIDASVEGVHFRPGWLDPGELGWRAAAAALSDLAAVAATPRGVLATVGVPAEWPPAQVAELMQGVGDAAAAVGAAVWGGDLIRSDRVIVDVAVVGELGGEPVRRRGAVPGDGLWVTGRLGGPAAALAAWQAGAEPDAAARARFARPEPRVEAALWLREHGAHAAIDLSDGLYADAGHLAAASGIRCALDLSTVPAHASAPDPIGALTSGEEYELLVAMPAAFGGDATFAERFAVPLTMVGRVETGEGVAVMQDGRPVEVAGGFRHF